MAVRQQVSRTMVLPASAQRVWTAIADRTQRARWLGLDLEIALRPGAEGIADDGTGPRLVVIEEVEPGRRLVFHWWPADADGTPSTVEILLEPVEGGTRIGIRESAAPDSPWTERVSVLVGT